MVALRVFETILFVSSSPSRWTPAAEGGAAEGDDGESRLLHLQGPGDGGHY